MHRGVEVRWIGSEHGIENRRRFSHAARRGVHPAKVHAKGLIVRAKLDQLIEPRDRLVEFSFEPELRGFLQHRGKAAPVLADLVGPGIGPRRLPCRSDREGKARILFAAETPVGGAQQLQRVPIARISGEHCFKRGGRLRVLAL